MGKHLSQTTKEKISKTMICQNREKKRLHKKLQQYEEAVEIYQDLVVQIKDKLKLSKIGNDKIYIPYHPDKNKEEREKLMGEFEKHGWEYVDARRIWDAPFNRWLYFWILKR